MDVALVCVPYANDVARWGAANGPRAFLDAGLADALRAARVRVDDPVWIELPREERTRDTVTNLGKIARRVSDAVYAALQNGRFALVLEGDCTHAPGAAGGLARASGSAGVVWFDAHGDMNTMQTTGTGLWGGMPYGVILGWDLDDWREAAGLERAVDPGCAALIGGSDLDEAEIEALEARAIARLDADQMTDSETGRRIAELLAPQAEKAPGWYLHVDVDVAGPEEVPGGLTPAPLWPPRENLIAAVEAAVATVQVRVMSLAAYNPGGDPQKRGARFGIDMAVAALAVIAEKDTVPAPGQRTPGSMTGGGEA